MSDSLSAAVLQAAWDCLWSPAGSAWLLHSQAPDDVNLKPANLAVNINIKCADLITEEAGRGSVYERRDGSA